MFQEKGLQVLLSRADAGIILSDPGLDLTVEVVKKLDAMAPKPAPSTAKPATPPAAAAPRPATPPAPVPAKP